MGVREGHVAGIPTIFLRVGFVGELGYELHVPASRGEALWDALMEAGAAPRHPALRRRGAAPAQAGEGPHSHRPGYRRPHHPPRGRHGLGARQEEAIPCRNPLGADAGGEGAHAQAGGLRDAGGRRGAAEGMPFGVSRVARSPGGSPRSPILPTWTRSSALPTSRPIRASLAPRSRFSVDGARMVNATVAKLPFFDPDGARQEL